MIAYNNKKFLKVCLCGSTRFMPYFLSWARWLTRQGCIVTMPMIFGHAGDVVTDEEKQALDDLHKAKILDCDVIFVINKDQYIGQSTQSEIEFARSHNKRIIYMEELTK